jgi:hypothetical protein
MLAREALAGPGSTAQHALIFLLALNRRRVSDATNARTVTALQRTRMLRSSFLASFTVIVHRWDPADVLTCLLSGCCRFVRPAPLRALGETLLCGDRNVSGTISAAVSYPLGMPSSPPSVIDVPVPPPAAPTRLRSSVRPTRGFLSGLRGHRDAEPV